MLNARPLGDRLIVERIAADEMLASGIVIPDTAKEKPQEATVIAVGRGRLDDDGERIPMEVHEGDRVLTSRYGGTEIKIDGNDYVILREDDVLAIIER